MRFSALSGAQWNKNETVSALVLPFPHHIRETTTLWENLMAQDTKPQPLLAFSGGKSCSLQLATGTSFAGSRRDLTGCASSSLLL